MLPDYSFGTRGSAPLCWPENRRIQVSLLIAFKVKGIEDLMDEYVNEWRGEVILAAVLEEFQ